MGQSCHTGFYLYEITNIFFHPICTIQLKETITFPNVLNFWIVTTKHDSFFVAEPLLTLKERTPFLPLKAHAVYQNKPLWFWPCLLK